jgi:hypothetical protein
LSKRGVSVKGTPKGGEGGEGARGPGRLFNSPPKPSVDNTSFVTDDLANSRWVSGRKR